MCLLVITATATAASGQSSAPHTAPLPEPSKGTARITLGQHTGNARAAKHGMGHTAGGQIEISQPAEDTIIIRMSGSVAASQCAFKTAQAVIDFVQTLQFAVDFNNKTSSGKLMMECSANGLLRTQGLHATVTMNGAMAMLLAGPDHIATVSLPPRAVGGGDSLAIHESSGPNCIPLYSGCFAVQQQFSITAAHEKGMACHRASAQFSSMPSEWIGSADPFMSVDASGLGYQLTIRAIPD